MPSPSAQNTVKLCIYMEPWSSWKTIMRLKHRWTFMEKKNISDQSLFLLCHTLVTDSEKNNRWDISFTNWFSGISVPKCIGKERSWSNDSNGNVQHSKARELQIEQPNVNCLNFFFFFPQLVYWTVKYWIYLHLLWLTPKHKSFTAHTFKDKAVIQSHLDKLDNWLGVNKTKINTYSQKQRSFEVQKTL